MTKKNSTDGIGHRLYKRAKEVIPGGTMLLSKRPEMFLPDQWPAYFERAKGCSVWDLDGRHFIDMSIMSVGTNLLGYGNEEVDAAVREVVNKGNMSTLNAPEEVYLAEKLIDLHPWAQKARFARSGGEANAIAVRIARGYQGGRRSGVAVCGYHGWHDWYLAANLADRNSLGELLLPGLDPTGVPDGLRDTVFPFSYGDLNHLESLIQRGDIGVVKMEVSRSSEPDISFLQSVRSLTERNGVVLIFDECTSGFREAFGGLHKKVGVEPDMAMFGKALGSGYAVTAVLGRAEIMRAAESSFISSTFWTERIGSAAALATLEVMGRDQTWSYVTSQGKKIRQGWNRLADKHGLALKHTGLDALAGFTFESKYQLEYKTLLTQEMLKRGYLAATSVYVSTAHTDEVIDSYIDTLDAVFGLIAQCEDGAPIAEFLEGPICHSGFKRLN